MDLMLISFVLVERDRSRSTEGMGIGRRSD
jgi:hypothetical protein